MRGKIICGLLGVVIEFLSPRIIQAQGTTYLSNLGQPSASSNPLGSDSWMATGFMTGTNAAGYALDSTQLLMLDAAGLPAGFTVSVYSAIGQDDFTPLSSLGTLDGSLNPITAGVYTYNPSSTLTLSPITVYFIVATAGTPVATGGYEWSNTGTFPITYNPVGGWEAPVGFTHSANYQSSDGISWSLRAGFPQFAVNATPIPEPGLLSLLGLGALSLLWHRRKAKSV
jgi:hypothetical protein